MKYELSNEDIDREKKSDGLDIIINTLPDLQQPQYAALRILLTQQPEVEIEYGGDGSGSQAIPEVKKPVSLPAPDSIGSIPGDLTPLKGSDISSGVLYGIESTNATSPASSDASQGSFVSRLEKDTNNKSFSR